MKREIKCPFCEEDGFDLVGLKIHLTGEGYLFAKPCQAFTDTFTEEEERNLKEIKEEQDGETTASDENQDNNQRRGSTGNTPARHRRRVLRTDNTGIKRGTRAPKGEAE